MKSHFKSFFLVIFINFLLCLPVLLFLEAQFLVPTIAFLGIFNAYLYLFHLQKILKHFPFQHFGPNDPWKVTTSFKSLEKPSGFKNVNCYKTKVDFPVSICFGNPREYFIIFSESLLDALSEKEIKLLLSYYIQSVSNGSTLFLTLISGIIYCLDGFLFLINYPFKYFQKTKPVNFLMVWILYILSWPTKPLFSRLDRQFAKTKEEKKLWASLLWKLDSLYKLEKRNFPIFFTSLFLANPLTNNKWECYISLQPKIRSRVKNLIGSYPP